MDTSLGRRKVLGHLLLAQECQYARIHIATRDLGGARPNTPTRCNPLHVRHKSINHHTQRA